MYVLYELVYFSWTRFKKWIRRLDSARSTKARKGMGELNNLIFPRNLCASLCTSMLHDQRKFRNLTSDYSCCWRSVNLEMWSRRCDTAEMWDMRNWRVGSARKAVFFHSFVASKARKGRSEKRELRRIGCPRCRQNLHHACARERFGSQNR